LPSHRFSRFPSWFLSEFATASRPCPRPYPSPPSPKPGALFLPYNPPAETFFRAPHSFSTSSLRSSSPPISGPFNPWRGPSLACSSLKNDHVTRIVRLFVPIRPNFFRAIFAPSSPSYFLFAVRLHCCLWYDFFNLGLLTGPFLSPFLTSLHSYFPPSLVGYSSVNVRASSLLANSPPLPQDGFPKLPAAILCAHSSSELLSRHEHTMATHTTR